MIRSFLQRLIGPWLFPGPLHVPLGTGIVVVAHGTYDHKPCITLGLAPAWVSGAVGAPAAGIDPRKLVGVVITFEKPMDAVALTDRIEKASEGFYTQRPMYRLDEGEQ